VAEDWIENTTTNQKMVKAIVGIVERKRGRVRAYGGVMSHCLGRQTEQQKEEEKE
jgi:hypothetical protein